VRDLQIQYKVGGKGGKLFPLGEAEGLPAFCSHPGKIRRALGTIGKFETGGRVEAKAEFGLTVPDGEICANFQVAVAGFTPRGSHNHQGAIGIALKFNIRISLTKLLKLLVVEFEQGLEGEGG